MKALMCVSFFAAWGCAAVASLNPDAGKADAGAGFVDGLRFGSSFSGLSLMGEGTSFSLATTQGGTVAFRLESQADMGTRAVRLYVYTGSGGGGAPYAQRDYTSAQGYGHIMLSSFRITDPGTYEVRAYLVQDQAGGTGAETHVMTAPITMTP